MILSDLPLGRNVGTGFAALLLTSLWGPALAQDTGATAQCDQDTGRCAMVTQMKTDDDKLFGTLTMQIGQDGSQPVLFAVAPLGIATRPGIRIVTQPATAEISLPVDVCYPDGCRASADLSDAQLGQLVEAETLSVQFINFSDGTTLAADIPAGSLIAPLASAGVTLPGKD